MQKIIFYIILLIFFFTPLESIRILGLGGDAGFSIVKLFSILCYAFALLGFSNIKWKWNNFLTLCIMYFIWSLLSAFWTILLNETIIACFSFLLPTILLCFIIYSVVITKKQIVQIQIAYIAGCSVLAIMLIFNYQSIMRVSEGNRASVLGIDQNELSFFLLVGISFLLHLINRHQALWRRIVEYVLLGIFVIASLSTGSRGGFICLILIFFIWLTTPKKIKTYVIVIITILLMTIVIDTVIPDTVIDRLINQKEEFESGYFGGRGDIWILGINRFFEHENTIIGIGFKGWNKMSIETFGYLISSHNTYLETMIELGFIGLGIYLYMLWIPLKLCYKATIRDENRLYFSYLLVLYIMMFELPMASKRYVFLLCILICCVWIVGIKINVKTEMKLKL